MASTLISGWTLGAALAVLAAPVSPSIAFAAPASGAPSTRPTPACTDTASSLVEDAAGDQVRVAAGRNQDQDRDRDRDRDRERGQSRNRSNNEGSDEERITKSFKVGASGSLLLTNVSGDIQVSGGSGSEIVIEAVKHARGNRGDMSQQLGNVEVSMVESGGRVEVRTYHRGKNDRSWVDYVVKVPAQTRVDVQSVSGGVQINSVQGETRAESVSGNVVGQGLGRVVLVKSVSGDVELSNSQSDRDLTVSSVSGDVRAASLKARSVVLNTVSGEAIVKGCECGGAQLKSVSGTLEYQGTIVAGGRYEANAHSGDIRIVPTAGSSGYELEASTFSGDIHTDPPLKVTGGGRSGRGPGQSLRGTSGSGGAFLDLTSFSGDIFVGPAPRGR